MECSKQGVCYSHAGDSNPRRWELLDGAALPEREGKTLAPDGVDMVEGGGAGGSSGGRARKVGDVGPPWIRGRRRGTGEGR